MKTNSENPLLNYDKFAPYRSIVAENIVPAVGEITSWARNELEDILETKEPYTFENTLERLIFMEESIDKVWTPIENLLSVKGKDDIREAAENARPILVQFYNDYSLDERVYKLVKKYAASPEAKKLDSARYRYLKNTIKDFKLSGAELEGKEKEEFKELNLKLAKLTQKFSNNVVDSKFNLVITDESDLAGLPEDIIQVAKNKAKELNMPDAWVFTLDFPSYDPFMKFADNGKLRQIFYIEYLNKASAGKKNKNGESIDNEPLIHEIYKAKFRKAKLLGFNNYAELSLQTKMAEKPKKVKDFLLRIVKKASPLAEKEYEELVEFQKRIGHVNLEKDPTKILPWDISYLAEKLRKEKFNIDTNITKQYFELGATIDGMFTIAEKIFGISFKEINNCETWDDEVRVFEVLSKDSSLIGTFYMDLHPRDTKRGGAWVMPLVDSSVKSDATITRPQCVLVGNITRPQTEPESKPALLTPWDVRVLFHEFGHALHVLFSKVELSPIAGTNVEWDFVELPSQLMENFTWEKESLSIFAKHYETGELIPDELLSKMVEARNFNEGIACLRQMVFALFDLEFYMNELDFLLEPPSYAYLKLAKKYDIIEPCHYINFPNSFSHIYAGGYSAGYYSYKWAEVLEADAFSRFKEDGVISANVGQSFRESILEKGDSEAPMELFKTFMGREPDENALLRRMGCEI